MPGAGAPPVPDVRCDVEFLVGGVLYEATAENLSVKGAFVAAEVGICDGLPGFSVEFESLDETTRARIRAVTEAD